MYYVLEGPAGCGNAFGLYNANRVPADKFAVVTDGEYANGGYGPCGSSLYSTREAAQSECDRLNAVNA